MQVSDVISMVTNVGFPVTLCFILIRYVLQTLVEKVNKLESSLHQLTESVQALERRNAKEKEKTSKKSS